MSQEKKTTKEIILETLKREKRPLKPKAIQELTNLNYNTIRGRLQDLKKAGLVVRTDEGWIYKEYVKEEKKRRRRR
ncbi:MAG: DNA-binding protein [Thermoprotei archaeon]|nr:MAG: DNA-binding protein [Thermoprotei archaeon]